jgi:hypothetical protein
MLSDTKHASSEIKSHSYQNDHQTNLKKSIENFQFHATFFKIYILSS